jgi:hypothetical protein
MIETVIKSHISRYPVLQIQDLYKLLHQASMGSEHGVPDLDTARNWLTRELFEMGEGFSEPLMDPISADGEIVRVHLRPYISAGYAPDLLLDAFVRTANEYKGDARTLEIYWQAATKMGCYSSVEMDEFFDPMKTRDFPPVHHSSEYVHIVCPAYRVMALAFCPKIWQ